MDLGIKDKTALVTGASRGIGRATAFALAREGANVAIVARGSEDLEATATALRTETGSTTLAIAADVSVAADIARVAATVESDLGGADILVAICGSPRRGDFGDIGDDDLIRAFEATTLAVARLCRAVAPRMRAQGWGRIVTVQARSVVEAIPALTASNATRPGVAGLMNDLSRELGRDGVLVNTVVPGRIATERFREGAAHATEDDEAYYRRLTAEVPVGRLGEAEEIANVVAFLASERASYVTGAAIRVDGGLIRSHV